MTRNDDSDRSARPGADHSLDEPLDPADEAASARLDGESSGLVGQVDEKVIADRAAELDVVRAMLAAPVKTPDRAERDAMITRAIALGRERSTDGPPGRAELVDLSEARRRRSRRLRVAAPLAGAAVIALLAVLVVPGLIDESDDSLTAASSVDRPESDDATARAADDGAGDLSEAGALADAEDAEAATAPPADAMTTDGTGASNSFDVEDGRDLLARLPEVFAEAGAGEVDASIQPCATEVVHRVDRFAAGRFDGVAAGVFVELDGGDPVAVTVVGPTCEILFQSPVG